jgi:hypothetical protein
MPDPRRICIFLALLATHAAAASVAFNQNIRPILSEHCFTCHGPDAANRQANLRLDLPNGARGLESEILRRISSNDDSERMPPPGSGKPRLNPGEIELVRQWVAQGTPWEPFWSFIPPKRPALPVTRNTSWPKNSIDRFLLARLEREALHRPRPAKLS